MVKFHSWVRAREWSGILRFANTEDAERIWI